MPSMGLSLSAAILLRRQPQQLLPTRAPMQRAALRQAEANKRRSPDGGERV